MQGQRPTFQEQIAPSSSRSNLLFLIEPNSEPFKVVVTGSNAYRVHVEGTESSK